MKLLNNLCLFACVFIGLLITSCSKTIDAPMTSQQDVNKKSQVIPTDDWFDEYESLVFENNYFLELIANESISEVELNQINDSMNVGAFDIQQLSLYLSNSEYTLLENYFNDIELHFTNVQLTASEFERIESINNKNVPLWINNFPNNHYLMSKACEDDAAADAVGVLSASIAAGAATAIFTGGTSVVVGVVGGCAASVVSWAIAYSRC
ncbi:MAG: hypothetical protein ABR574_04940 [Cryomorphaceae bacterium]|nr:hypothetical protein [Flavobacteriales bacterium]